MSDSSASQALPRWQVPRCPVGWQVEQDPAIWAAVPSLSPFILADGSGPAQQQTTARLCYDEQRLYLRFDCQDDHIWGTYAKRDDPIYDEEVVELFLWPGETDPVRYYEFEVSPNGVLFDGLIHNPTSQRDDLEVDANWDCLDIVWWAGRSDADNHWWAILSIPWSSILPSDSLPTTWRANLYRIERPRDDTPEFSCWSPVLVGPVDFHKPARFGILDLE